MAYNHGQDLAMVDLKLTTQALTKRLLWSLVIGLIVIGVCVMLGPRDMVVNVLWYLKAQAFLEVRRLPIFGVRRQDIYELVKPLYLMRRQADSWLFSLELGAGASAVSFGLFTYFFWRRGQRSLTEQVMRGARLSTPRQHNWAMRRIYRKLPPTDMGRRLVMGAEKLIVPESLQYLHFAFAGASGTGKSTAIREVMAQALERGDKGLVVDLGGAYYSRFGRAGDHVLSLRDPRSEAWDFWHEEGVPEEAMAAAMIEAESGNNPYFWKGARAVLTSLFRINSSVATLLADFKKPTSELREKLRAKDEISRRIIGEGDGDQADGIIGTTVLDFAFLKELNQWARPGKAFFSIARWMNDHSDKSWTYIIVTEDDLEVVRPLLRLWFDIACLAAMRRDPDDPTACHTWLFLDEIKTLGRLPSLPAILDKGRKFRTSVVLGFQAISQVQSTYGKDDEQSILQGVQNQILFGMTEANSAEYVSELLGEQEVEQASIGHSFGQRSQSDRGSVNRSVVRRRLVMPEEVRNLEVLHAFMRLGRHAAARVHFNLKNYPKVQDFAKSQRLSLDPKVEPGSSADQEGARGAVPPPTQSDDNQEGETRTEDVALPFEHRGRKR